MVARAAKGMGVYQLDALGIPSALGAECFGMPRVTADCDTSPAIAVASQSLQDVSQLHQATFEEMLPKSRPSTGSD